jgi:hypothetical protein
MAIGPIVSTMAREREPKPTWSSTGPIVGTVAFIVSILQFFLMYVSPYVEDDYGRNTYRQALAYGDRWLRNQLEIAGIANIVIFTLVTTMALLFLVRRIRLPRGTFLVILVVPALLQTVLQSFDTLPRVIGAAVAAVVGELTWPRVARANNSRYILPAWIGSLTVITWFGFFVGIAVDSSEGGVAWTAPLWTGVPFLAGLLAALLTIASERR